MISFSSTGLAPDDPVSSQLEALVQQRLLPAESGSDAYRILEEAFGLLLPGQTNEFGMKRMIWSEEALLPVKDWWIS